VEDIVGMETVSGVGSPLAFPNLQVLKMLFLLFRERDGWFLPLFASPERSCPYSHNDEDQYVETAEKRPEKYREEPYSEKDCCNCVAKFPNFSSHVQSPFLEAFWSR
jgi:hypothetical protein